MRSHYQRVAMQLQSALHALDMIQATPNLGALHQLVVELKNSLPERLAYENSPLLLDGLKVTRVDDVPAYAQRLRERLTVLLADYSSRTR